MADGAFQTRLTSVQEQLARLRLQTGRSSPDESLLRSVMEELAGALQALHVAGEELRQQNEELAATRLFAEEQWRRYQELFDQAPDAYLLTSRYGKIQDANRAAASLLDIPADHLLGRPMLVFVAAEDRRALRALLAQPSRVIHTEVHLLTQSGVRVPAAISVTEVREPGATRRGLRFLLRDLSETERTAQALRESEARFRTVFDHALFAILVLDDAGRILEANAAAHAVTGLDGDQLLGRCWSELLVDDPTAPGQSRGVAKLRRADGALRSLALTSRQGIAPGRHLIFAQDVTALEAVTADRELLRALAAHRFEAQEEAARRIARELHDEAGEVLTNVHLRLDELASTVPAARRRVREVRGFLDEVEQRLRRVSHELRPTILDDLGLVSALEHLVEGVAGRTKAGIEVEDGGVGRLPPAVETALYRIAQESLANAVRHAQAKRICISVFHHAKNVVLSIQDDGVGFDAEPCLSGAAGWRRRGLGLVGIRERVEALGGVLVLRSAPGHGVGIRVSAPV